MSRRFGRYLIRDETSDELGRGAFGRVYRAFDPNVNRYVAVKVLSSSSDPELLVRFQDESKTAGQLEHENIVKVYDFDLQDGMPYLVMQLLEGETLETVIRTQQVCGRPVQLLDKVEIMFQVAKGLQYAHSQNVVHRDIKPGNIMVLPNGTAKMMDFGIARVMNKDGTRRTRQGDVAGTILYMAPEQFSGRDADKRTDIFAYADVYYELLAGEHPFSGNDFATVMYRITAHDPQPIRERVPECPVALERMIHRLLVKDREIRPDRLEEVIFETQPLLQYLRRERAALIASEIEPLITTGERERAQAAMREALRLDPLNQVADRYREQFSQERDQQAKQERARALLREGQQHLSARRFKEALQSFESALKLDPPSAEIRSLIEQAQVTLDNVRTAGRLVTEARTEMERGHLERAVERAARAVELDAGNGEASQLRDQLRQQIRSRREAAALARAESLCNGGEHDSAVAVLAEAEAAGLSSPRIAAYRRYAESARAEAAKRRRQARFTAALTSAKEALYNQRLSEASEAAESLCAEYPEQPAAPEFRSEVQEYLAAERRHEDINRATQTARRLIKENRLDNAREVLKAAELAYPRDSSITRLMEIVDTLRAGQERARKIDQLIRQAHGWADNGQLDEALQAIATAIGEFGEDNALVECRRNFQLERDQREYARGLQARIEQGRRLLAESNPVDAIDLLEDAMLQYPGETEVAMLLQSARSVLAALRESEFVKQHRSQIAALEAVEQYVAALALMEAALARYPGNADLQDTARRLRLKVQEQGRRRRLAAHVRSVEEAIQAGNWDSAATACEEALFDFPGDAALAKYSDRIQEAQRQLAIQQLQSQVRGSLARQDLEAVERQLSETRHDLSQDVAWQTLLREFERYRAYDADLKQASEACAGGSFDRAEELLRPWLHEAPDPRASELFETISRARREAEERARREAEELARQRREAAIAKGRSDASVMVLQGDCQEAVAILDRLALEYPDQAGVKQDRTAAVQALERQQEEAAIVKGRCDAADLVLHGSYEKAIAILDRLAAEHPGRPEIRQDREEATFALARQLEESAIAKGRSDADALVRQGNCAQAIAILDKLASEYAGHPEVRQDWEAAIAAQEHQQKEAAIASGRSDANGLVEQGDHQGAIAKLDELAGLHPHHPEILRDREAAIQRRERDRRETEELIRRQQAEAATSKGRSDAEALVRQEDYRGAIAILDRLSAQHAGHPEIQEDREAAARALALQVEAAIVKGRGDADALVENGDYQGAIALLNLLAGQYPDSDIQHDLEVLLQALQQHDADERTRLQREAAIAKALAVANALVGKGEHESAVAALNQLAAQYPGHLDIQRDLEAAIAAQEHRRREAATMQARRQLEAITQGRSDAEVLARNGDYEGAIATLERLAAEYPDRTDIQNDREAVIQAQEHQRREAEVRARQREEAIAKGRSDADGWIQQGDYDRAIAILQQLAAEFSGRPEIQQDREAAIAAQDRHRREVEAEARQQQESSIARERQNAAGLVQKGDYRAAVAILQRLAQVRPGDPAIQQELESTGRELDRQRREMEEKTRQQEAVSVARAEATALVASGDHEGAMVLLERLAKLYPGRAEIEQDREAAAIAGERRNAAGLVEKGDHEAAIGVLRELVRKNPGHAGIQEDLDAVTRERDRRLQEDAIAQGRRDAAVLMAKGAYEDAVGMLDRLSRKYGDHAGIEQDRQAACAAQEGQRRLADEAAARLREEAAIASTRRDAGALIEQGDPQRAIRVLDELAGKYPGRLDLERDREAAQRKLELLLSEAEQLAQRQREDSEIAQVRTEADALLTAGNALGALELLELLASVYPTRIEIQGDREAVQREFQRQRAVADAEARRQREEEAIEKARVDAAELIQGGDYPGALVILDSLAGQFPAHGGVRQDHEAILRKLDMLRREAEEQTRRERELSAIAQARLEAAEHVRKGEHQNAIVLLDRLASQYPDHSEIRADQQAVVDDRNRQLHETEARAQRALLGISPRPREVATKASEDSRPMGSSQEDAEQRARWALAKFAAQKQVGGGRLDPAGTVRISKLRRTAGIWRYWLLLRVGASKRSVTRVANGGLANARNLVAKLSRKG